MQTICYNLCKLGGGVQMDVGGGGQTEKILGKSVASNLIKYNYSLNFQTKAQHIAPIAY